MRLETLTIRGLGPFTEEVSLDLRPIEHRILAVTGANGAGKSTTLELFPAALYRECPTRGSLASLATRRDAFVEAQVVHGQRFTVRQLIDGVSGKGETVLLDENGAALNSSGKLREADAWLARHTLPREVVYASMFAHQGSAGFLDLKPTERKKVLLRVLGIERLEAMAEKARERARSAKDDLRVLQARIHDEEARGTDQASAQLELERAKEEARQSQAHLNQARLQLETAQKQALSVAEQWREWERMKARQSQLRSSLVEFDQRYADLSTRRDNNQGILLRRDEILAASERAKVLDALIREADLLKAQREQRIEAAATLWRDAQADAARNRNALSEAERSLERVHAQVLSLQTQVEQALQQMPVLEAKRSEASQRLAQLTSELEALHALSLHGATGRIQTLRGALEMVVTEEQAPRAVAQAALVADDAQVIAEEGLPHRVSALKRSIEAASSELATLERELSQVQLKAAKQEQLAELQHQASLWERKRESLLLACAQDEKRQAERAQALELAQAEEVPDASAAFTERANLERYLKLLAPLAQAEARIAELEPQLERVEQEREATKVELDTLVLPSEPMPAPELKVLEVELEKAERIAQASAKALALAEHGLAESLECLKRLSALEAERRTIENQLADWTRLGADLGKDGIQALEVDAAGPELSALVNDLLHTCHGSRFTVSIETTKLSADGKRQLEGCDVWVLDTVGGREGPVETFSGGERVLVGEAVSLALSVLACQRAGLERPTLVRDETGAALDAVNGRAYVAMLRRAADIVDADKVLFVSHSPELQALADAHIVVSGEGISVKEAA